MRLINMRNPLNRAIVTVIGILVVWSLLLRSGTPNFTSHLPPRIRTGPVADPTSSTPWMGRHYEPKSSHRMSCDLDMEHLRNVQQQAGISETFQYLRRYVRFKRTPGLARAGLTKIHQELAPDGYKTVTIGNDYGHETCLEPLVVNVPMSPLPATVDASALMFGIVSTYGKVVDPDTALLNEWLFWLTDSQGHSNGARLLLMLIGATDVQLQQVAKRLGDLGIKADVYFADPLASEAVRYLTLIPTMYKHPEASAKRWLVTCEDDTFFPNMHALIEELREIDHTRRAYVGTLSEDIGMVNREGSQAFGGAGVFLSLPMAKDIDELFNQCSVQQSKTKLNGDALLRKCIYDYTETRLTQLRGLWQLDFYGNPSGFYEWGIKPLSVHHYRGPWHQADPLQLSRLAHTCGEDCTMLRFQTTDDFIVSGHSVARYPEGITFDHRQIEATMWPATASRGWNLDFALGSQRPSLLRTGRKIAWEMVDSEVRKDGSVIQTFVRWKDDWRWVKENGKAMSDTDGVVELVWIPG